MSSEGDQFPNLPRRDPTKQAVQEREMQQTMRPNIMGKERKTESSESCQLWLTVAGTAAASELGREIPCDMQREEPGSVKVCVFLSYWRTEGGKMPAWVLV